MYYYEILVSSQRYHGAKPLTYSADTKLRPGAVVQVSLGNQSVVGIISGTVTKPSFQTKGITGIVTEEPIPSALIELHAWLLSYYPGPAGLISQLFLPSSLGQSSRTKKPATFKDQKPAVLPSLTDDQQRVTKQISTGTGSFLLHGETGSGKTRVYLELASAALRSNKSAIILTPEIGLTPQLYQEFESTFPGKVVLIHSTQTPAQRRDNWMLIHQSTEALIVVGPRSALFSPLKNVGLIVLDEAHDPAYKQDQMPYYQTSRVAAQLAHLHTARLVMGSATPLIHDYYTFQQKQLPILRMESSAIKSNEAEVSIIDLKDRSKFSKSAWLSDELIQGIESSIREGLQSLIFLNRRGTARVILCQNCGWQAICPRCDLPLTYHGDTHRLQCHTCGLTDKAPISCPECQQAEIRFKSIGTKSIATEIERLFPDASVMRFDSDNKKADSLAANYDRIKSGGVDIIVGTQMLSKGLDLPLLRLVGVVMADTSLYFPDYSAEERTFQMLRQIIGRVGRGHTDGKIVLQSYQPDSKALQSAVAKDFAQFYESQITERELYHFPPFYFVLKVSLSRAVQATARKAAHEIAHEILQSGVQIELSGPAPAFVEKTHDRYHWQLIIKAKQRSELVKIIAMLPKNCSYDIDPSNLL